MMEKDSFWWPLKENALLRHGRFSKDVPQGESQNTTVKSPPIVLALEREQPLLEHTQSKPTPFTLFTALSH